MSRRHRAEKRKVLPDPRFNSVLVTKFINCMMYDGKKSVAEGILYRTFAIIAKKTKLQDDQEVLLIFVNAIDAVKPHMEVKSRRVGGATYQVPIEVSTSRAETLAIRWLIEAARGRSENTMEEKLAAEILLIKKATDESSGSGNSSALKKRENTHRMADANKAFAHFRW